MKKKEVIKILHITKRQWAYLPYISLRSKCKCNIVGPCWIQLRITSYMYPLGTSKSVGIICIDCLMTKRFWVHYPPIPLSQLGNKITGDLMCILYFQNVISWHVLLLLPLLKMRCICNHTSRYQVKNIFLYLSNMHGYPYTKE